MSPWCLMPFVSALSTALIVAPLAGGPAGAVDGLGAPVDRSAPRTLRELPPAAWQHERRWVVSSDDWLFGRVGDVEMLADGCLAVADVQLGQIMIIGPEGNVDQVYAVAGEGPGQLPRLSILCERPGGELWLVQAWPGRVEVVRRDGTPLRSLRLLDASDRGLPQTLLGLASGCDLLVGVQASVRERDGRTATNVLRLRCFDDDLQALGDVLATTFVTEERMGFIDETAGYFPQTSWAVVDSGLVVVAPDRDAYRLELRSAAGAIQAAYVRALPPLPRAQEEKDRLAAGFSLEVNGQRRAIEFVFHETAEMIQAIVALGPQRVLLRTAYCHAGPPAGATARLDLVDLAAGTVQEIRLAVPVHPHVDRLVALPSGDLVVLKHCDEIPLRLPADASHAAGAPEIQYWRYLGGDR
ncbi:MAG: hypothetical protein RBT60_09800 [Candidatus Krumholzibacteria bacterium]|nr:hypothetical protein [Candidatus Krumholzibacteria bacterium]